MLLRQVGRSVALCIPAIRHVIYDRDRLLRSTVDLRRRILELEHARNGLIAQLLERGQESVAAGPDASSREAHLVLFEDRRDPEVHFKIHEGPRNRALFFSACLETQWL
jgi:hypothetical protein